MQGRSAHNPSAPMPPTQDKKTYRSYISMQAPRSLQCTPCHAADTRPGSPLPCASRDDHNIRIPAAITPQPVTAFVRARSSLIVKHDPIQGQAVAQRTASRSVYLSDQKKAGRRCDAPPGTGCRAPTAAMRRRPASRARSPSRRATACAARRATRAPTRAACCRCRSADGSSRRRWKGRPPAGAPPGLAGQGLWS
jgi:hypothetical protein